MKSEIMQKRFQQDRALMEQMRKSGLTAQMEKLHKQIVAVAPEMFRDITVEQPEYEPETPIETRLRMLAEYQAYCRKSRENDDDWDYETLWEVADEMRYRTNQLEYDIYADAYRYAVKHYTVKGKPIKSIDQLDVEYFKAKNRHPKTLKTYSSDWDK